MEIAVNCQSEFGSSLLFIMLFQHPEVSPGRFTDVMKCFLCMSVWDTGITHTFLMDWLEEARKSAVYTACFLI